MKITVERILIIALFAWIMFQTMCNTSPISDPETIHYIDTVKTTVTKVDTFIEVREIEKHHYHLRVDTFFQSTLDSSLTEFKFPQEDSLLTAMITAHAKEQPIIDFEYTMKQIDIRINTNTTTTIEITDSSVTEVSYNYIRVGAEVAVGSSFGFIPKIGFRNKKGFSYDVGYDLLNKNYHIGFAKSFSLKPLHLFK